MAVCSAHLRGKATGMNTTGLQPHVHNILHRGEILLPVFQPLLGTAGGLLPLLPAALAEKTHFEKIMNTTCRHHCGQDSHDHDHDSPAS